MKVRLRFFASLREALGEGETVDLESGSSLGRLRDSLIERGGEHARLLARGRAVRCALDRVMVDESALLTEDAEIAFFPPVTGG